MDTLEMMAATFRAETEKYFEDKPRRRYPQRLREQAVQFTRQAHEANKHSLTQSSRILGVSDWALRLWMRKAGHEVALQNQRVKPVVIRDEVIQQNGLRLILRSGHQVHGLSLAELVLLIEAVG